MKRRSNVPVWIGTIAFVLAVNVMAWGGTPVTAENLLHVLVFALPLAGIYAMSASGLVVVYTTTGIFNFAQGAIGMFLAYVYWELSVNRGWPVWLSFIITVLVAAPVLGIALDRLIMRRLQGKPLVVQLMVTVGLMFAFIGLAGMVWDQTVGHSVPALMQDRGFHIGDVIMTWHRFITLAVAVGLAIGLRILLFRTRLGISMRAVVDNRGLAALAGARSDLLSSFAWALGCAVAAMAGIFLAPESDMSPGGSLTLLIITSFAAAVVGRLRSLPLTYVGALILGISITWSTTFLQFGGRWGQVPLAIPTVMLFIVLLLLPEAPLQFARIARVRHPERPTGLRDTIIGAVVLFVAMAIIASFLSPTNLNRFALGMCTALVALSLVPLIGWAGQVSLAPLAFAGIGAVAYTRFGGEDGNWYAVLWAALVVIPIGAILALPTLRLQGLYLALATLAFAALVDNMFFTQPFALGGAQRRAERLHLFGIEFTSAKSFLLLVTAVFGILGIGISALRRGRVGRRLIALRDSEAASVTVGVNVFATKVGVFMLHAGLAGFAGAFLAMYHGTVAANQFSMLLGLPIVLALVIGGVGLVAGALFAGMFGLFTILIKDNWHLSLFKTLEILAPGLAAIGIIQNPSGAVVPMGEGFAPLLPWRRDARKAAQELKDANAEPEVGDLGLERSFTEEDVLLVDRNLGISNDVPRAPADTRASTPVAGN
jgi:branched-chain amino acid transport system permease protein